MKAKVLYILYYEYVIVSVSRDVDCCAVSSTATAPVQNSICDIKARTHDCGIKLQYLTL